MACLMIFVLSVMEYPQEPLEDLIFKQYSGVYFFYSKYRTPGIEESIKETILFLIDSADKIVHFMFYACLSIIFYFDYTKDRYRSFYPFFFSAVFSFSIGFFLEVCQRHVPTRSFSYNDLLTNFLGATVTMLISFLIYHIYHARRKRINADGIKPH